jgi:hypothetical protein
MEKINMKESTKNAWIELTEVNVYNADDSKQSCKIVGKGLMFVGEGGFNHIAESSHTEDNSGSILAIESPKITNLRIGKSDNMYNMTSVKESFDEIKSKLKEAGFIVV